MPLYVARNIKCHSGLVGGAAFLRACLRHMVREPQRGAHKEEHADGECDEADDDRPGVQARHLLDDLAGKMKPLGLVTLKEKVYGRPDCADKRPQREE